MNSVFARRLRLVTTLEIVAVLWLLVFAGALLVLGNYVGALRGDMSAALDRIVGALATQVSTNDARVAGAVAASRYPRSNLVVLLIDEKRRVTVFGSPGADAHMHVEVRTHTQSLVDPHATGTFARVVVGLVTALGLQNTRAHVGKIDVLVRPNESSMVLAVESHVWEFGTALLASLAFGAMLADVLTRQALRPLLDVTSALERFAAGDLEPHTIVADKRHQLGSLAVAYNGTIDQMERAFAERDRANDAMRQFIADAGHQLRTPLTVVRGFISILRKGDLRTPEDAVRILDTMNRQSAIMASLIDKLMLLDRWEAPGDVATSEKIDVARLVSDVLGPIVESHPARDLRVDAPEAGLAGIDPTDFAHAIVNVVDNALKYTTGAIDVRVRRDARQIVVEIVDEGPGMSPGEAEHACDRFFRGSRRDVEGSGLGLAIARSIVIANGGTLAIASDPAAGSRFRIALPASG
ncbi:MAG: hypothetical protein NVSMB21_02500 [Vulcanimicrobiaceae bacterium]